MGLLDGILGTSIDDPRTGATAAMVQGLLGSNNALGGMSQGLLGYQDQMARSKRQQQIEMMQKMQLAEMQRAMQQQAAQDKFRASIPSPQMQIGMNAMAANGGFKGATAPLPQADPQAAEAHAAYQAGVMPYDQYKQSQQGPAPMKLSAGDAVFQNGKMMFQNPKEQQGGALTQALQAAGIDPASPQGRQFAMQSLQKMTTHQPGTHVNVNTAKPLMNTIAEGLGRQIDASLEQANSAIGSVRTAQNLMSAIDSGKVIAGPTASFRVAGLQLGQMLGIGGKDAAETLSNTRTAIQSMAQAELDAAAQMKGQGQITEAERSILKRAASGDIDSLTAPEIRQLAVVSDRAARTKITRHRSNVDRLKSMPEAAPLIPFYGVDEPPAYSAPGAQKVRRFNPATGKIE